MLETIHDMLNEMKKKGINDIEPYLNIGHNPTIGEMYEGLTRELLNKAIFNGLNLKVVSGKIKNSAGIYTKQIDCMIVIGEGIDIPFTDKKVYEIKDVIAVIEVKKNLFSKEIEDSYENLKSVIDVNDVDRSMSTNMVRSAFKSICGEELPIEKDEVLKLSEEKQLIYHSLVMECYHPARIVFGYTGFVSEHTLREKFLEFIKENAIVQNKKGYSPVSLPSLIICGNSSLIKTNGIPYVLGMQTTDAWMFYGSYNKNPILLLLEVIWTRLTFHFKISSNELFENYLNEEIIRPLLIGQPTNMKWEYIIHHLSQEELIQMDEEKEWEPVRISICENVIFMKLCENNPVYVNDAEFLTFLQTQGEDIDEIISHLTKNRLIYLKDNEIKLLTEQLKVVCVKGDFYAAETKDNRFYDWLRKKR